jgi:hypothetical protein
MAALRGDGDGGRGALVFDSDDVAGPLVHAWDRPAAVAFVGRASDNTVAVASEVGYSALLGVDGASMRVGVVIARVCRLFVHRHEREGKEAETCYLNTHM